MNRPIHKLSVIGGFGFSFFAQFVGIVMLLSSLFAIGSLVLFALAASRGWTEDANILKEYGWSQLNGQRNTFAYNGLTLDGNFATVEYVGLKGAYTIFSVSKNSTITVEQFPGVIIKPGEGLVPNEIEIYVPFSDSTLCPTSNCPYCETAGLAVVRLVSISAGLSFFVFVLSIARAVFIDSLRKKIAALLLSFIAIALSVAAFSTWHISCILKSKSTAQLSNAKFEDKFGYSATAAGFILMGIAMVLHLSTPLRIDKSHLDVQKLASPLFGHDGGFQRSDKATDFGIAGATELSVKQPSSSSPASPPSPTVLSSSSSADQADQA